MFRSCAKSSPFSGAGLTFGNDRQITGTKRLMMTPGERLQNDFFATTIKTNNIKRPQNSSKFSWPLFLLLTILTDIQACKAKTVIALEEKHPKEQALSFSLRTLRLRGERNQRTSHKDIPRRLSFFIGDTLPFLVLLK